MNIYIIDITSVLQVIIGGGITLTGFFHLVCGSDVCSKSVRKFLMIGLIAWAGWFTLVPFQGPPDSPPSLAFAGLVCYLLIKHAHTVRAILGVEKSHETHVAT